MLSRRHFLLATPLVALSGCSRKAPEEPLWIGHVAPFSGSERTTGEHARNGMLLAVEQAKANRDGKERSLAVLHADSQAQIDQARHEAVRLVSLNKVLAILGGHEQHLADRLGQALQSSTVPLVTPAAHGPLALERVFSLEMAPEFRGECLARFAGAQRKGKKAILVVDDSSPACTQVAREFARQWRKVSGNSTETWNLVRDKDALKLPKPLEKGGAEVLLFAGKASDLAALGKLSVPVLFGGEEMEWRRLEKRPDLPGNLHAATVHVTGKFDEDGKAFLKKYEESHFEPADADAWQGYEMMRVVTAAVRLANPSATLGLSERLAKKDASFPGLTGSLTFKEGRAQRPVYIVKPLGTTAEQEYPPPPS